MKIAVLTLTRDRLEYTQHCFARLRENAGCDFDHYVLDQGSSDGTAEWLPVNIRVRHADESIGVEPASPRVYRYAGNLGISRGMNFLLDHLDDEYDVIVKFDNDCELTQPNTLRDVCALAIEGDAMLSPRICGLNNPPAHTGEFTIGDETILDIPQIGGIFLAAPARVYDEFRFNEYGPGWGQDDVEICQWFRSRGGRCGYVKRLEAWHYETTSGQHNRYPDYFARTLAEGKPAL